MQTRLVPSEFELGLIKSRERRGKDIDAAVAWIKKKTIALLDQCGAVEICLNNFIIICASGRGILYEGAYRREYRGDVVDRLRKTFEGTYDVSMGSNDAIVVRDVSGAGAVKWVLQTAEPIFLNDDALRLHYNSIFGILRIGSSEFGIDRKTFCVVREKIEKEFQAPGFQLKREPLDLIEKIKSWFGYVDYRITVRWNGPPKCVV